MNNKYRAWESVKKEWICEGFHLMGEMMMGGILFDRPVEEFNNVHVDTFTGLVDMDGTDIYENDILKVGQWIPGDAEEPGIWLEDTNHVVKWHGEDGYPAFDLSPGWKGECNALAEVKQGGFLSMKVIGNTHQNPELVATE